MAGAGRLALRAAISWESGLILQPEDLGEILLAMLLGGPLGAEREFHDKAAGSRTLILISVGACLFTLWSLHMGDPTGPTRIAANIVTGIGFLGAGVILREGGRVMGLTPAAMIWLSAALGKGVGSGQLWISVAATLIIMVVLWFFPALERAIDPMRETRTCEITLPTQAENVTRLEGVFRQCGLRVYSHRQVKTGNQLMCVWEARGTPKNHEAMVKALFDDPDVRGFRY
jgi:putative Mg2+ transporter-C (MgtC) family protein